MKKEELLAKLRANTQQQYDMPSEPIEGIHYQDTLGQFIQTTRTVGGEVVQLAEGESLDDLLRRLYPEARVFASNLPEVKIATLNPDTVAEARDLNGTDVGVVRGQWGVAENACVWVPQTMKEKALLFISENLVIVLPKKNLVDNMHQTYDRITMDSRYNFGTFISGPSKTADIEQALVMGAQAARSTTVVLIDE